MGRFLPIHSNWLNQITSPNHDMSINACLGAGRRQWLERYGITKHCEAQSSPKSKTGVWRARGNSTIQRPGI